jgi:hypothetical protein
MLGAFIVWEKKREVRMRLLECARDCEYREEGGIEERTRI